MSLDIFAMIQHYVGGAVGGLAGVPPGLSKPLPAHRWDAVSFNGKHVGKVTDHGVGFDVGHMVATVHWNWDETADPSRHHVITATIDKTGHATIKLDGHGESNCRIAFRPITSWQGQKISFELIFDLAGVRQDYRFDGRVWP